MCLIILIQKNHFHFLANPTQPFTNCRPGDHTSSHTQKIKQSNAKTIFRVLCVQKGVNFHVIEQSAIINYATQ